MSQGIKVTDLNNLTQTASDDIMYVVDSTDTVSKKVELQSLLYDNMVTPAKLSTGAPTWTANGAMVFDGAIYTDQIIGRESADSLILRADPQAPSEDLNDGGPMIQMFSADRLDGNGDPQNPNQIYYRANYHIFQNKAGDLVAQIPPTSTPTQNNHLVRKDYVDTSIASAGAGTFNETDKWQILPSGLIMQWGEATTSSVDTITFEQPYTAGTVPNVQITRIGPRDWNYGAECNVVGLTNTGFRAEFSGVDGSSYAKAINWFAIGY